MRKDYGAKYVCFNCAAKFYDLGKPEAICPICEVDQAKRPKKKEKKSFRSYEEEKPQIDVEEKIDLGDGTEEALLIEMESEDLEGDIGDGAPLIVEEDEEE